MDWSVKIAKEIIGKWGYEEKEWWQHIAEALNQSRQDLLKSLVEEVERMKIGVPYINDDPAGKARALAYQETHNQALKDVIKLLESKE